jgi:predicted permease
MARAAARKREMSVRMALGSGRGRLVRLWLIESAVLCVAAAALGLVLASWILDVVVAFEPPTLLGQADTPALALDFTLDVRVFAFTLVLSGITAILTGLISGLQATNPVALGEMKTDRTSDRRFAPGFNLRSGVIALQMAMSVILLIPGGLFVRSALNASAISPGFDADNVLLLPISADQAGVRVNKPAGFDRHLVDRVAALPGVESATAMDPVPLWFAGRFAQYGIEGSSDVESGHRIAHASIAPAYFQTLRIPLTRGRDFTAADSDSAPPVAIVNETMAWRFWPGGDAIGRRIRRMDQAIEIVGVVRDSKYATLADAPRPFVYQPLAQSATTNSTFALAVRSTGDSMQLRDAVEREVRALVPTWPAFAFRALDEGVELQQLLPRAAAAMLGALGLFGLLLAAVGIYGVMSYVVRQRTHEIGIRLALGSPISSVLALLIKQGMTVCVAGGAVGLVVAFGVSQFLTSALYEISGADPVTFVMVPLLLSAVALLACYLPARGAGRVNPLEVLRRE